MSWSGIDLEIMLLLSTSKMSKDTQSLSHWLSQVTALSKVLNEAGKQEITGACKVK